MQTCRPRGVAVGCGDVCSGMTEPLGVQVWKVWREKKDDVHWAADLERVLSGRSAAEKQEAFRVVVRAEMFCWRVWERSELSSRK